MMRILNKTNNNRYNQQIANDISQNHRSTPHLLRILQRVARFHIPEYGVLRQIVCFRITEFAKRNVSINQCYFIIMLILDSDAQLDPSKLRKRTKFTRKQHEELKKEFDKNKFPDSSRSFVLATNLCLSEKTIRQYFATRRAMEKRSSSLLKSSCSTDSDDKSACMPGEAYELCILFNSMCIIYIASFIEFKRPKFTFEQLKELENEFNNNIHPEDSCRHSLATKLNLSEETISEWFQNRRAREKLKEASDNRSKGRMCETLSVSINNIMKYNASICLIDRTTFSHEQTEELSNEFNRNMYANRTRLRQLSDKFDLPIENISAWFRQRRLWKRRRNASTHRAIDD